MLLEKLKRLVLEAPYNSERRNILRQIQGEFATAGKMSEQNFLTSLMKSNRFLAGKSRDKARIQLEYDILIELGATKPESEDNPTRIRRMVMP